jgi:hypothetical protein
MKTLLVVIGCLVIIISNSGIAREEGLLLLYSFEEGSGATVKDLSGNGNDGALQGDATWTKNGKIGGCVSLDGDGDFVDCGANEELQLLETDFTLAAWVYPQAISQQSFGGGIGGTIFQTVQTPRDSEGFALGIKDTGLLWWWNTHNIDKYSVSKIPLTTWTHVTVVFEYKGGNNNTLQFYIDGGLDATASGVPDMKIAPTNLGIGHRSWITGWFKGSIDEARVYARALEEAEIEKVMTMKGAAVDAKENFATTWGAIKCHDVFVSQTDN